MLKNMSIRWKLQLSTLAFVGCILALAFSYTRKVDEQVVFAKEEKTGNEYQRAVMPALLRISLLQHTHQLGRDTGALVAALDQSFTDIEKVNAKYGEALQFTDEGLASRNRAQIKLSTMRSKWERIKAAASGRYSAALEKDYAGLIADMRTTVTHLGDTSNLILDPDLDSYYMMDMTLLALPQTIDRLGKLGIEVAKLESLNVEESLKLAVILRMMKEADHDRIVSDMDTVMNEDANFYGTVPALKSEMQPKLDTYRRAIDEVERDLNRLIATGDMTAAPLVASNVLKAQVAASELWEVAVNNLDTMLDKRIEVIEAGQTATLMEQILGLFAAQLFFFFIVRSITRPLDRVRVQMLELAEEKIQPAIDNLDRKDEIGGMASALEVFQHGLIAKKQLEEEQKAQDIRLAAERKKMLEDIAASFEATVKHSVDIVASAATEMDATAQSMESNIMQSNDKLQSLMSGINTIAGQVESVSASTGQLSQAINEISSQVTRATSVTQDTVHQGEKTTASVVTLEESAKAIQQVVDLINQITGQINLLALNATIEAARAGDAGKGFAVVASEVKALADQTGKATDQIVSQINAMQSAIDQSSGLVRTMVGSVGQVSEVSTIIAAAVEEQGAATKEIASSSERSKSSSSDIIENAKIVSTAVEHSRISANEMRMAAQELSRQAETLRNEVQGFLGKMRAA